MKYCVIALRKGFEHLEPNHLLPKVIKTYAKTRSADGVSPGTILREIGVLRAALSWGVENQWIAHQPIVSNPVKTPKSRDRWLTKDEARKLIDACRDHHIRAFVQIALMTAARSGAIVEARWDQIDAEHGYIDFGPGHGNKRRAVAPINDELRRVLDGLRALACSPYIVEYHGRQVSSIKKGFAAACRRAGLTGVSPHILRHTAATWMAIAGVPMREIARMLGDEEKTVERVYAKYHPAYLRRAASALQLGSEPVEGALQPVRQ